MIISPPKQTVLHSKNKEKIILKDEHISILKTMAYSNIFDYPLTYDELFHFVYGMRLTKKQFDNILFNDLIPFYITERNNFFTLVHREKIVDFRQSKYNFSEEKWKQAYLMSYILSHFPFVRMISITGSLIFDNLKNKNDDIDFFIIIEKNHLWKTRLLIYTFVRLMERFHIDICPNYIISSKNLDLPDKNFYSARELRQMIPLYGFDLYEQLMSTNKWIDSYYPNALSWKPLKFRIINHKRSISKNFLEKFLSLKIFTFIETFEMKRQIRRLKKITNANSETIFTPDCAKCHIDGHGNWIKKKYNESLKDILKNQATKNEDFNRPIVSQNFRS